MFFFLSLSLLSLVECCTEKQNSNLYFIRFNPISPFAPYGINTTRRALPPLFLPQMMFTMYTLIKSAINKWYLLRMCIKLRVCVFVCVCVRVWNRFFGFGRGFWPSMNDVRLMPNDDRYSVEDVYLVSLFLSLVS